MAITGPSLRHLRSSQAVWCLLSRVAPVRLQLFSMGGRKEDWWEHGLAKCSAAQFVIVLHLFCTIWTSAEPLPSSFSMTPWWSVTIDYLTQMEDVWTFSFSDPQGCVYSAGSRILQQTTHFSRVTHPVFIPIYKCLPALRKMFWSLIKMQFKNKTHLHCTRFRDLHRDVNVRILMLVGPGGNCVH